MIVNGLKSALANPPLKQRTVALLYIYRHLLALDIERVPV